MILNTTSSGPLPQCNPQGSDAEMLEGLAKETFDYFLDEVNPANGLITDKTERGWPCSIAAVGMALTCYPVAVTRKYIDRLEGAKKTVTVLKFFHDSEQSANPEATGYKGFYYHFIDMKSGKRVWNCELSTIDTAFLIAGALTAAQYFDGPSKIEQDIRALADSLYRRVDWQWALNEGDTISHGWRPESGFIEHRWNREYSEALILYILALGSPTHAISEKCYATWTSTFALQKLYDTELLYAGPLFIHQLSHQWIDFRNIYDDFNTKAGFDYFENSRRATFAQQRYAIDNPHGFAHYGKHGWGFTASDGPGNIVLQVKGVERTFYDYIARGAPFGPDDGTISPWAVVGSIAFAPEIVIETIRHAIERLNLKKHRTHGFDASFNPTYPETKDNPYGWVSPWKFGLNEGPIIVMIENFRTQQIWKLMQKCPAIKKGLLRAGFKGGWLTPESKQS